MSRNLSTAEASRILGMKEARIREMVRAGLCRPARSGHRCCGRQTLIESHCVDPLLGVGLDPRQVLNSVRGRFVCYRG